MKIPKIFVLEGKYLEEKTNQLLEKRKDNTPRLLESCTGFLEEIGFGLGIRGESEYESVYKIGEQLVKELRCTRYDLERLSKELVTIEKDCDFLGYYLSALVNKIITKENDYLTLELNKKLRGVGTCFNSGILTIKGSVGDDAGFKMRGGKLIVKGDAGNGVGNIMEGGTITVEGNSGGFAGACAKDGTTIIIKGDVGESVGYNMKGKLIVHGKIGSLPTFCWGEIYRGNKKIWPW